MLWRGQGRSADGPGLRRRLALYLLDIVIVGGSFFFALHVRGIGRLHGPQIYTNTLYALTVAASLTALSRAGGLNRHILRYFGIHETAQILRLTLMAIGLGCLCAFIFNRLDDVPRGVVAMHGILIIGGMTAGRLALRFWDNRNLREAHFDDVINVVVVGINHLAALYIDAVGLVGRPHIRVVGVVSDSCDIAERMRGHPVLGPVENLDTVLASLRNHGVRVDRLVVTVAESELSANAQAQIAAATADGSIGLEPFCDVLKFPARPAREAAEIGLLSRRRQSQILRRLMDIVVAGVALVVLSPVVLLTALLVWLDVGRPLIFWQERPGRFGAPFRIYKFRTMGSPLDAEGNLRPETERTSAIGLFIRRFRFDEIPQLVNVLTGKMALVGPRPLLARDQPAGAEARLNVRPGITGWAQVHGGQTLSMSDKGRLDVWYTQNATLALDLRILLLTVRMLILGDDRSAMLAEMALASLPKVEPTAEAAEAAAEPERPKPRLVRAA